MSDSDEPKGPVERKVRRSPHHLTHHDPSIHMAGCPGCEIERMIWFILRNCDPYDMGQGDAETYWNWHKMMFPENWRK